MAEDIVYGDSLADKITVTATDLSDSTEVENFTEYELKYYDEEKNALENEPKNAGSYYVEAVVRETVINIKAMPLGRYFLRLRRSQSDWYWKTSALISIIKKKNCQIHIL